MRTRILFVAMVDNRHLQVMSLRHSRPVHKGQLEDSASYDDHVQQTTTDQGGKKKSCSSIIRRHLDIVMTSKSEDKSAYVICELVS